MTTKVTAKTTEWREWLAGWLGGGLVLAAMFACVPALAQTYAEAPSDMATPPRLAVAEGDVQFWRPGAAGWEPAQINMALAEGDAINAGGDATVELQVGRADFVRMMADSWLILENTEPEALQFRLAAGAVSFDLRGGGAGQRVRIDTERVNIAIAGLGYYRIQVRPGETRIVVRNNGRAAITLADGRSRDIVSGEEVVIENGARVDSHAAPAPDAWDGWNDARSEYYAASTSARYVSPDVYGAADLDRYGNWREDNTYGSVWVPSVAAGWTPYSSGRWYSDAYYGWTWVDVAPWGWATTHYGRWVHVGGSWAWAPGPGRARLVYAPALVAFFEGGGGMSWVALGWGEPLLPWWGRPGFRGAVWWGGWSGPRVVYQQNTYIYRNTRVNRAIISVREADFGRRTVRGSSFSVPADARRPVRGELPVRYTPAQPPRRDAMPPRPQSRVGAPRGDAGFPSSGALRNAESAPQNRTEGRTENRNAPRPGDAMPPRGPARDEMQRPQNPQNSQMQPQGPSRGAPPALRNDEAPAMRPDRQEPPERPAPRSNADMPQPGGTPRDTMPRDTMPRPQNAPMPPQVQPQAQPQPRGMPPAPRNDTAPAMRSAPQSPPPRSGPDMQPRETPRIEAPRSQNPQRPQGLQMPPPRQAPAAQSPAMRSAPPSQPMPQSRPAPPPRSDFESRPQGSRSESSRPQQSPMRSRGDR